MRKAIVAGQFYPEDKTALRKQIDSFFSNLETKETLSDSSGFRGAQKPVVSDIASLKGRNVRAGISPHAGYIYSGKCAGFLYQLLRDKQFDTFLILGTNHSGLGEKITFSIDDFETVFGKIESDMEIIEDILVQGKKNKFDIGVSEEAHKYEHSIEVQLPFLQTVQKKFKIVPCLVRDLSLMEIEKLGRIISNIVKENEKRGKKIFILASSDFTHYGRAYGFLPFADNIGENLYALDNSAIDKILKLDVENFYGEARRTTICGFNAVAVCVSVAKNLGLNADKLCYYTSGDISGKWDNAVGYASVAFS